MMFPQKFRYTIKIQFTLVWFLYDYSTDSISKIKIKQILF